MYRNRRPRSESVSGRQPWGQTARYCPANAPVSKICVNHSLQPDELVLPAISLDWSLSRKTDCKGMAPSEGTG